MTEPLSDESHAEVRESIPLFGETRSSRPSPEIVKQKIKNWENPNLCDHKGVLWVDRAARTVECDKCGIHLDPIECLFWIQAEFSLMEWKYEKINEHERKEFERRQREHARREARRKNAPSGTPEDRR